VSCFDFCAHMTNQHLTVRPRQGHAHITHMCCQRHRLCIATQGGENDRPNGPTFDGRHRADRRSLYQNARRGAGPLQRLVMQQPDRCEVRPRECATTATTIVIPSPRDLLVCGRTDDVDDKIWL
jgi:hypothetical protein